MGVPRRGARAWLGLLLAGGCGRGDLPAPVEHTFSIAVLADPHLTAPSERDVRLAAAVDWIEEQREARKIELVVTEEAVQQLASDGYDPQFGARPLKRTLQRELENPLATALLEGRFGAGSHVVADVDEHGELVFRQPS